MSGEKTPQISNFTLSEEHTMLQDMARQFFHDDVAVTNLRKLRDESHPEGIDRQVWQKAVDLGFAGILIPEAYGGTDFGMIGMGLVMQEAGKVLASTPLLSSSIVCASLILHAGNEAQKQAILPGIASGDLLVSLALEETGHHNPLMTHIELTPKGTDFELTGSKTFVLDGHISDKLIVAARTSGQGGEAQGLTLCLIDAKIPGVTISATGMVDSRNASNIDFEKVHISQDDILGEVDQAHLPLEFGLDMGRIALSAEMLGAIEEVFEQTLEYLKERKQFGVPIGSFQALRHRASHMFSEIEVCRAVVAYALSQADKKSNKLSQLASLAKARLCETSTLVTNEGLQMHGGIGMTDDIDIGLFMKRARVQVQTFGDAHYHRARYAGLSGY